MELFLCKLETARNLILKYSSRYERIHNNIINEFKKPIFSVIEITTFI